MEEPPEGGDDDDLRHTRHDEGERGTLSPCLGLGSREGRPVHAVLDHGDDEVGVESANSKVLGPTQEVQPMGIAEFRAFEGLFDFLGEGGEAGNIRPERGRPV